MYKWKYGLLDQIIGYREQDRKAVLIVESGVRSETELSDHFHYVSDKSPPVRELFSAIRLRLREASASEGRGSCSGSYCVVDS